MLRKLFPLWSAVLLTVAIAAGAQTMPAKKAADGTLTDAKGMTLYTFDKDAGGKSACNGPCATNWPPLMAMGDAQASGDWTIVTRDDGGKQYAYKGKQGQKVLSGKFKTKGKRGLATDKVLALKADAGVS